MSQRKLYSRYDVVIVGSGIAGLLLAIELDLAGMRTAVICKGRLADSNTTWAQGGVAICTGANPLDDPARHLEDTLAAGAGLTDPAVAREIIESGPVLFDKLEALGLDFDRDKAGHLELAREGGHCQARVLHSKDASGRAISQVLISALSRCKRVAIFEEMFAVDLLTQAGHCIGLRVLHNENLLEILAPRVVLASGGLGQVYSRTTNPAIATGDGIAMAYRAGAVLADMEFVQFHPTALSLRGAPASLMTEALRGSGAHLLDRNGERFAFRFHKDGELATRDVVARAILSVMQEEGSDAVSLDIRPLGAAAILENYPNIVQACRNWGIDPLARPIPVAPAAHYFMGGIYTDGEGRSSLPGLYAIGECASTGLHGANRLASNSLLEGGVMALKVARSIIGEAQAWLPRTALRIESSSILSPDYCSSKFIDSFKERMFDVAGLIRNGGGLAEFSADYFQSNSQRVPMKQKAIESANIGMLGMLINKAAFLRKESRGAHWRSDYPAMDDAKFAKRFLIAKDCESGFAYKQSRHYELRSLTANVSRRMLSAEGRD
ncbi:MAG: L-aspartate oxidase [Candidatus Obscuribacterales bacterium]|nr:L-aspartate oxidase [Candidatus Obscuribacterales bacterium]